MDWEKEKSESRELPPLHTWNTKWHSALHCIFWKKKKLSPGPVHRHTCKIWTKREQRTAIRLHDDQKLSKLWRH